MNDFVKENFYFDSFASMLPMIFIGGNGMSAW